MMEATKSAEQQQELQPPVSDSEQVATEAANQQKSGEELDSCMSADSVAFEERLRATIAQRRLARQCRRSQTSPRETPNELTGKFLEKSRELLDRSEEFQRDAPQAPAPTPSSTPTADLKISTSFPIYHKPQLAPTTSAPVAGHRRNVPCRGYETSFTATSRRQHRGARREKTSLKLNRFFESSVSMLPQPSFSRRYTSGSHVPRRSSEKCRRPYKSAQEKYATRTIRATNEAVVVDEQQMAKGDFYQANLQDHQDQLNYGRRSRRQREQADRSRQSSSSSGSDYEYDRDVDGGYAWIILVVVFVINASTFGTARAYGLIFDKLARIDEQTRAEAALPFTIMGAIENMAGPLAGCLLARTSSWRLTVFAGSCLVTLAHLFAALAGDSQLGQLLSMGLMSGLGLSFVSISFFQVNNAYFVRYRNTAFGVGMTGAAFGTLYISPLCQYFLDNYEGTRMCYLMLGLIIAPNVPLSLLLKPKQSKASSRDSSRSQSIRSDLSADAMIAVDQPQQPTTVKTISENVERQLSKNSDPGIWASVKQVVSNYLFHLIWPTQLLFCWFNFVFGMIIVDFGKDRGLNTQDVSHLIPVWAFGQLVGRLVLSTLVDLKFLSYRSFTVVCFGAISITTYLLNNTRLNEPNNDSQNTIGQSMFSLSSIMPPQHLVMLILAFVLSMFIALLYILLNGLIVNYIEKPLQPLSIGISSFTGSFFLLPRAYAIGYYRDIIGNYDSMLTMFTFVSLCAALTWLIVPTACKYLRKFHDNIRIGSQMSSQSKNVISVMTPYSTWKLTTNDPKPGI